LTVEHGTTLIDRMTGPVRDRLTRALGRLESLDRIRTWTAAASDRAILRRSVVTCLIVGAVLTLINQGDALLRGEFDSVMAWKIGLTFLVPFVVATMSGAAAVRVQLQRDRVADAAGRQVSDRDLGAEAHADRRG